MPRATKSGGAAKAAAKKAPVSADAGTTAAKDSPAGGRKGAGSSRPRAGGPSVDRFHASQRKALVEERDTYTRQAATLRAEAEELARDREPGDVQFDEESGQGDSTNVERERDLALSAQALAAVEEIDRALARIDDGTYGRCERCGAAIPRERLKALPYASLCVRCKSGGLGRR